MMKFVVFQVCLYMLATGSYNDESDCGSSFVYQNATNHIQSAMFISSKACREGVYCHAESSRGYQLLRFINGTKAGQQFVFCISLKAGTTRINQLMYKILYKDYDGIFRAKEIYQQKNYNPLKFMDIETLENLLSNEQILKILMVRDPFVRAISMYQDKILTKSDKGIFLTSLGFGAQEDVTFDQFVERLHSRSCEVKGNKRNYDGHFVSQTEICKVNMGIGYNYQLKMEEMDKWFDCFVDKLNIREEAMHGWPGQDDCFLSTTKTPCTGVTYKAGKLGNAESGLSHHGMRQHTTNSTQKLKQYYSNQTILQMVAKIFEQDIINFGYPIPTNL